LKIAKSEAAMRFGILHATRSCLSVVLAATIVLGTMAAAWAAVTYFGLTFPDRVGGAKIGPTVDYEKTNAGLGYSVEYLQPGWKINIYIYDMGRASIPDDLKSEVLQSQLKQAQGDILELQRRGTYAKVELLRDTVMSDRRGRARLLCSDFGYVHETMGNVDSFLCLTGWNNKFVKFRLTRAHHDGSPGEAKQFLEAWLGILWP
jgi:hypothetical protein